ncbi:glycosyltransferase [Tautonia plasticadhaerens]|uniref:N-acetylglucosaminyl-diphospho-decaprenol L-rhamnosyltransferase n=1 Tax=Tautonia plasticadhaerens TaxID=2527974 RepID=A0A518GY73_9BACT|nr:glycosyltransferase [Tautonia plasticadhaerens]QDV33537.1 N-acetylglucosaminyl-diphospho-decaprenol L-rhamnosyltransferase [Tautonia plasticadhaerens]
MPDRPDRRHLPAVLPDPDQPSGIAPPHSQFEAIRTGTARMLELGLEERDRWIRSLEARVAERDRRGDALRGQVVERGLYATWLQSEIDVRDRRVGELLERLDEHSAEVARISAELEAMRSSRAWRAASLLQGAARGCRRRLEAAMSRGVQRLTGRTRRIEPELLMSDTAPATAPIRTTPEPVRTPDSAPDGPGNSMRDPNAILRFIPPRSDPYDEWLRNNAWDATRVAEAGRLLDRLERRPRISVVVATHGVGTRALRETLSSLREQIYPDREVILVGGTEATAASVADGPVIVGAPDDEPFRALREAVDRASGEYVVVLEQGARLAPDALLEYARAAAEPDEPPVLIYSDEDRVARDGSRFGPRFRPGWSPEALLSHQAIGRTFAVRRSVLEQVGGIRVERRDAWAYDLALRLSEIPGGFERVPRVLVHVPAERGESDPIERCTAATIARMAEALVEAMGRRGIVAGVSQPEWASRERFAGFELGFPEDGPKVAILIPTRDRVELLRRCVDSVLERTAYGNFEIVIIDNGSERPETLGYLAGLGAPCRVVRSENDGSGFNYARLHNEVVRSLDVGSEFVVFLNNDTEVRRPEWLGQLVGYGSMPGVGAVGARLLYADGRVQHAGILTGLYDGNPGHAARLAPWWDGGDQRLGRLSRNLGAVTAACMLVRRSTFLGLGGFDQERFAVGYNDVDFCLRLGRDGLRCVFAPRAELLHFEGASRGFEEDRREAVAYRATWGDHVDPFHHPALSKRDERLGVCTRRLDIPDSRRDRPIRVAYEVDRLDGTGNGRFLLELATGLRDRGLVVPSVRAGKDGPIGDRLRDAGIRVEVDGERGGRRPIDHSRSLAEGGMLDGFDLVHAIGLDRFTSIHAARLAGIPALWTVRQSGDFRDAFAMLDDESARAAIEAFSDAYRVTFPAWGVRRPYHPVESRWNYEVVREEVAATSGFPDRSAAREALGIAPGAWVVACVHDSGDDGARDFLDAVLPVLRSNRAAIALISTTPESMRDMAREEGVRSLGDRLRFIAASLDPIEWLPSSDLLVCPSRRDLSPGAMATGRALGLPIILAAVAGIDEFSTPGRDALVYEPGDAARLRSRIEQVLVDPAMLRSLSAPGGPVEPAGRMVPTYDRLYREAIAVGSGRGKQGSRTMTGAA